MISAFTGYREELVFYEDKYRNSAIVSLSLHRLRLLRCLDKFNSRGIPISREYHPLNVIQDVVIQYEMFYM